MNNKKYKKLSNTVLDIAKEAGRGILDVYNRYIQGIT